MTVQTCAGCSTRYAMGLTACPHCGSSEVEAEGAAVGRLPLFVRAICASCERRWNLRLNSVQSGLVEIPVLFCASCGSQVQVPWPPVEDDMPTITKNGGPSNARAGGSSPDATVSTPLAGAEAGQGHSTDGTVRVLVGEPGPELVPFEHESEDGAGSASVDYNSLTLAELKALAAEREVATYGSKAQIAERLREDDQEV